MCQKEVMGCCEMFTLCLRDAYNCVYVCVQVNVRKGGPHSPVSTVLRRRATRTAARVSCAGTLLSLLSLLTVYICLCVPLCVPVYVCVCVCARTHA